MTQETVRVPRRQVHRWLDEQSPTFYRFVAAVLRIIFRLWIRRYRSFGANHVPATGGAFLIANHSSAIDPLALGLSVPHRILVGPGKVELFVNPVFSWVMRKMGIFPLHRAGADPAAVRSMVEAYRKGRVVIVYPEGGRSTTGEMMPFFEDFTRLALRLKAPLIPAGIAGARDVLPIGSRVPKFNTPLAVYIGEGFDLSSFYERPLDAETIREATAVLWNSVHEAQTEAERRRQTL